MLSLCILGWQIKECALVSQQCMVPSLASTHTQLSLSRINHYHKALIVGYSVWIHVLQSSSVSTCKNIVHVGMGREGEMGWDFQKRGGGGVHWCCTRHNIKSSVGQHQPLAAHSHFFAACGHDYCTCKHCMSVAPAARISWAGQTTVCGFRIKLMEVGITGGTEW